MIHRTQTGFSSGEWGGCNTLQGMLFVTTPDLVCKVCSALRDYAATH